MTRPANTGVDRAGSVFRVYMGGNAIINWCIAMTDSRSLVHGAAASDEGAVLSALLMLTGALVMLDAVINDLLPCRYHWRVAVRQRHFLLTAMAFCYVSQLFAAYSQHVSPGLLMPDMWAACWIMLLAFVDAHQRSKDAQCAIN